MPTVVILGSVLIFAKPGASLMALLQLSTAGTFTAAAGANNNATPDSAVNIQTLNRLRINSGAGVCNLTGLAAGLDGQLLWVTNTGANAVTLNSENAGSTITNRFKGSDDLTIQPNDSLLIYYDTAIGAGTPGRWIMGV